MNHERPALVALEAATDRWIPRILTNIDRDPLSRSFGCADRDWWHYRIRDFPSIILQQSGYALWCASQLPRYSGSAAWFRTLAGASVAFWAQRARRWRAFEEYYPWEEGYPPLAFSTLAAVKLIAAGAIDRNAPGLVDAATVASRQLHRRFESEALNQQIAGIAALLWLEKVYPALARPAESKRILDRVLAMQHAEGWFPEYGGPDIGYLSVSLDCLWDAFDASGDPALLAPIKAAALFVDDALSILGKNFGMHNSRNTDYIAPYGLARAIAQFGDGDFDTQALERTLDTANDPAHFLVSTDDRYICHYLGHSLIRAEAQLASAAPALATTRRALPGGMASTYWMRNLDPEGARVLVTPHKGGIVSIQAGFELPWTDHGVRVDRRGRWWVSHWWTERWRASETPTGIRIDGVLVGGRDMESTPLFHILLRGASFLLGRRLIQHLKRIMIFRAPKAGPAYRRVIELTPDTVVIHDELTGLEQGDVIVHAPRASKRHVASADSFHADDMTVGNFLPVQRQVLRTLDTWKSTTTVTLKPTPLEDRR